VCHIELRKSGKKDRGIGIMIVVIGTAFAVFK
jgi:hypothetical protein